MEKVQKIRQGLPSALCDARNVHSECSTPVPEEFASHDMLVRDARNQATKYGFMAFVDNPDTKKPDETGAALRKQLRIIYDTHCTDTVLWDFLGESLVQSIADILAVKSAASSTSTPRAKRRRR